MAAVVQAEVKESSTEVPALGIAAASSMVLVCGLAFAVQEERPAASIHIAGWVALAAAIVAALGLLLTNLRRASRGSVEVRAGDGELTVAGRRVRYRSAYLLAATGEVEVERASSTLVIAPGTEIARALPAPPALARYRLRADYLLFVITIWAWLAVYGALCVIPPAPALGVVLTLLLLPLAALVTLRAIPGTVVVTPSGVELLRSGRSRSVPASSIAAVRVKDDVHVLLVLDDGEEITVGELHEHPREPQPGTPEPPAARLERRILEAMGPRAVA